MLIADQKERSELVQQNYSTTRPPTRPAGRAAAATDHQNSLLRGLTYGIILSMAVWTVAGYLTFALR
jgi:hypothetical protein